MELMKYHARED